MSAAGDASAAFVKAMEDAGMRPDEPVLSMLGDGRLIRFRCEGDKPGKRNGWAVLHLDGVPAGAFGNYRLGISERWKAGNTETPSPIERRANARRWREQSRVRQAAILAQQQETAERCLSRWSRARPVDPSHRYLLSKGICGEGLRQEGAALLVPMFDADSRLWNLQRIFPDGSKRFAKGGRQSGLSFLIGEPDAALCIAEGYGTGAVVRRASGLAVAVAFSGPNMVTTAQAMRKAWRDCDLIVMADDDPHLVDNPRIRKNLGMEYARAAAQAVGGRVAVPPRTEIAA